MACLFFVVGACEQREDDSPISGTVTDVDGNTYNTVKIGSQVWSVENLKTTKYNDGTEIAHVTDDTQWGSTISGAYCSYGNLESNADRYGRFYNWYAVNSKKIAPQGWHVATEEDWVILELYLIDQGYNYDGSDDENRIIKSLCATTDWDASFVPGTPGESPEINNRTGFTAIPTGYRGEDGTFYEAGKTTYWWTSTEQSVGNPYFVFTGHDHTNLTYVYSEEYKEHGFSVRLVKD